MRKLLILGIAIILIFTVIGCSQTTPTKTTTTPGQEVAQPPAGAVEEVEMEVEVVAPGKDTAAPGGEVITGEEVEAVEVEKTPVVEASGTPGDDVNLIVEEPDKNKESVETIPQAAEESPAVESTDESSKVESTDNSPEVDNEATP